MLAQALTPDLIAPYVRKVAGSDPRQCSRWVARDAPGSSRRRGTAGPVSGAVPALHCTFIGQLRLPVRRQRLFADRHRDRRDTEPSRPVVCVTVRIGRGTLPNIRVVVQYKVGLHARPATRLVKLARNFLCDISLRKVGGPTVQKVGPAEERSANAKSIMDVLSLGLNEGDTIEIEAEGDQSEEALVALQELVEDRLGD